MVTFRPQMKRIEINNQTHRIVNMFRAKYIKSFPSMIAELVLLGAKVMDADLLKQSEEPKQEAASTNKEA